MRSDDRLSGRIPAATYAEPSENKSVADPVRRSVHDRCNLVSCCSTAPVHQYLACVVVVILAMHPCR